MRQFMNHRLQLSMTAFLLAIIAMPLFAVPQSEMANDPTVSIYSIANSKKKSGRHISISPQVSYTGMGNNASSANGMSVYETSSTRGSFTSPGTFGGQLSGGTSASQLMSSGSKYGWSGSCNPESENGTIVIGTPHRVGGNPPGPFPDPIGDAMIPLAVLACAYLIWRVMRKRRRA